MNSTRMRRNFQRVCDVSPEEGKKEKRLPKAVRWQPRPLGGGQSRLGYVMISDGDIKLRNANMLELTANGAMWNSRTLSSPPHSPPLTYHPLTHPFTPSLTTHSTCSNLP